MTTILNIEDVRKSLICDLESEYTQHQIEFIDSRLEEIRKENNLSYDDLEYYCSCDSSEMFSCIFDYKEFDTNNFNVDW